MIPDLHPERPEGAHDAERSFRRHLLFRLSALSPAAIAVGIFLRSRIQPFTPAILLLAAVVLLLMGLGAAFARAGRALLAGAVCFLSAWWLIAVLAWVSVGSLRAPGVTLLLVMPLLAVALLGRRRGRLPAAAALGTLVVLGTLELRGLHPPFAFPSPEHLLRATLSSYVILAAIVYYLGVTLEGARRRAEARLIGLSRLGDLRTLALGLTHEINNPLLAVSLNADRIERCLRRTAPDLASVQQALEQQRQAVARIAALTTGLGALAAGDLEAAPAEVPVSDLVEGALAQCRELLEAAAVRVEADIGADLRVHARAAEVRQVLLNLLCNGLDAVSGREERWIGLRARRAGEQVEIRLSDSGPGVPAELRGQLFSPFFSTKRPGRGLGLGLVGCAAAAHRSGGCVFLDEAEPRTTFVLSLPAAE